jgi:dTDP-4-amino-4,6-dideoxygalactose transaminase
MDLINNKRMSFWNRYYDFFASYEAKGLIRCPLVPPNCEHNAHMFYLVWPDREIKMRFLNYMKETKISVVTHYVPLHSSPMGRRHGRAFGSMKNTDHIADVLLRLPLYYNLEEADFERILNESGNFLEKI